MSNACLWGKSLIYSVYIVMHCVVSNETIWNKGYVCILRKNARFVLLLHKLHIEVFECVI